MSLRYTKKQIGTFFRKDLTEFYKSHPLKHGNQRVFMIDEYFKKALLKKNAKKYMNHDLIYKVINLIYNEPAFMGLSVSMGRTRRMYYIKDK